MIVERDRRENDVVWNESFIKSCKKGSIIRSDKLSWQTNHNEAMEKVAQDPEWIKTTQDRGLQWKQRISASLQGISYDEWDYFVYDIDKWRDWSECYYLNDCFEGCHRHHITETLVIHIPGKLHQSVSHCLKTGRNMCEINILASEYLCGD